MIGQKMIIYILLVVVRSMVVIVIKRSVVKWVNNKFKFKCILECFGKGLINFLIKKKSLK